MRLRRLAAVAVCALLLTTTAVSAAATDPTASSVRDSVRDAAGCTLDGCSPGDGQAVADVADATAQTLADTPRGQDGPGAWVAQAAALADWEPHPSMSDLQPSLVEALLGLYASLDEPVTPSLADRVHATAAQQPADAADAAAHLVAAVREAVDAADTIQARHDLPDRSEASAVLADDRYDEVPTLAPDHRARLAGAAVSVADALQQPALQDASIELPLVTIGAGGDSTHTNDHVILVDVAGDDTYHGVAGSGPAGVGVGITMDQGDGQDTYRADTFSQGVSIGGVGLHVDEGGSDTYELLQFGQGFGLAGIGTLYDRGADDDAYLSTRADGAAPIGTKAAGLAGIGLLVDEGGEDEFRQDGLDGFVYGAAGGTGLMATLGDGDDTYTSLPHEHELLGSSLGNFTGPIQISSEVDATALLYEEGGDDVYDCGPRVRQGCQSAAGPGSVALLLDREGDDLYTMGEAIGITHASLGDVEAPAFTMGQAAAYSLGIPSTGPGVAVLQDAAGDDVYEAQTWAQGYASAGVALLEDRSGEDTYRTTAPLVGERGDQARWLDGPGLGLGIDR